jgi:hypothetical protein
MRSFGIVNNKWFGSFSGVADELHVADRLGGGVLPFTLLSGNDNFGSWVQILGSTDTPLIQDRTLFDLNQFLVTVTDSTNLFIIQIVTGESAGIAAKILAESFDEFPYITGGIIDLRKTKIKSGTKVWARTCCIGADAKSISFYFGIQESNY